MKMIVFDAVFITEELDSVFSGKTSLEIAIEEAKKNKFDRYILLQRGAVKVVPDGLKNIVINEYTPKKILEKILEESRNCEDIVIADAGNPFYDYKFIDEMLARHNEYFADFTYSIGYPEGLIPKIVKKDILPQLISLVEEEQKIEVDYLFYSISKDINSFDIETFLSDIDMRVCRLKFGANDTGERVLTKKVFDKLDKEFCVKEFNGFLSDNVSLFYTVPYMITFELNNRATVESIYLPKIEESSMEVSFDFIKKSFESISSINNKINVVLGGIGESLAHPDIVDIIEYFSDKNNRVIIESNGVGIEGSIIDRIINIKNRDNVYIVLKFDSYNEETYNSIHTGGNFKELNELYKKLIDNNFNVYKMVVRMNENEVEIEKYIRNKEADNLIIKKYSNYCGLLKDRKVVDLSPFERIPCFHLRREVFVRANGDVLLCQYNYNKIIANMNDDDIQTIIDRLENEYSKNTQKDYYDFCKDCDDYYIFNF